MKELGKTTINTKQFDLNSAIEICDSVIDTIDFRYSIFNQPVLIKNCLIDYLLIHSSFFAAGLVIDSCVVKEKIQFEMGGHNKCPIIIQNNIFCKLFVFFDCIFDDRLIVKNNIFKQGSTVFNKTNTFGLEPFISDNIGPMDLIYAD